jgi:multidrug efflux system membrane fusion protein
MSEHTVSAPDVRDPAPPPPGPRGHRPAPPSRYRWLWLPVLLLIAVAAYYLWSRGTVPPAGAPAAQTTGKRGEGGGRGGRGGIPPVVAVRAKRGDIGVYVTGLGTVTPINTVTVKTRVDGQLMQVYYREGNNVKQGQPLAEIDPRPYEVQLEQYQGQLARDQAALNNAQVDLTRYETLLKQNAVPEQQYATQKATVAQDEAVVKSDQGLIDAAKLNLTYCHITAPITGRIGLRLVDPGNIVHASDTTGLLVITQMQPISIIFPISATQLPPVLQRWRAGQHLQVEGWDQDQQHRLAVGTLSTIDNQIDQTTLTVRLRADFANTNDALFPNQFVFVRLLVEQKHGVVLLPTAAIQRATNRTYVWLINPNSTVAIRDITVGTTEGEQSEITSGVAAGDVVAMTGVDKLTDGVKVTADIEGEQAARGVQPSTVGASHIGTRAGGKRK